MALIAQAILIDLMTLMILKRIAFLHPDEPYVQILPIVLPEAIDRHDAGIGHSSDAADTPTARKLVRLGATLLAQEELKRQ
jgi:hypothetical protein